MTTSTVSFTSQTDGNVTNNVTSGTTMDYFTNATDSLVTTSTSSVCVTRLVTNEDADNTGYIVGIVVALLVGIVVGILAMIVKQKFVRTTNFSTHNLTRCDCLKANHDVSDIEQAEEKPKTEKSTTLPHKSNKTHIYVKPHKSNGKAEIIVDEISEKNDPKCSENDTDSVYEECSTESSQNTLSPKDTPSLYINTKEDKFNGVSNLVMKGEDKYEELSTQEDGSASHLYDPLESGDESQIYVNTDDESR